MRQIKRKRLRHAYHVLADPRQSPNRVAEIAWCHGFTDVKYFHRSFKAEFGHTPKETAKRLSYPTLLPYGMPLDRQGTNGHVLPGWTLPFGVLNM